MYDLVLSKDLENAGGIAKSVFAPLLPNFRSCESRDASRAAKQKAVLLHVPSYEVDDGALIELGRSGGAIVFSFADMLKDKGFRRAILISKMRLLLAACRRAKCGFVFVSLADGRDSQRNSRELCAFSVIAGIDSGERKASEKLLAALAGGREK
jgi:RNase P/RNase MRP subunit p30